MPLTLSTELKNFSYIGIFRSLQQSSPNSQQSQDPCSPSGAQILQIPAIKKHMNQIVWKKMEKTDLLCQSLRFLLTWKGLKGFHSNPWVNSIWVSSSILSKSWKLPAWGLFLIFLRIKTKSWFPVLEQNWTKFDLLKNFINSYLDHLKK